MKSLFTPHIITFAFPLLFCISLSEGSSIQSHSKNPFFSCIDPNFSLFSVSLISTFMSINSLFPLSLHIFYC